MTPFDRYHELAAQLLEKDDFPLPLPKWDRDYPHNIGLLSDAEDSALAAAVLQLTNGMSYESWKKLDMEQRISWMEQAVKKAGTDNRSDRVTRAAVIAELTSRVQEGTTVVTADEVAAWPNGLFDQFLVDGILTPTANAKSIVCDACDDDHVESVQFVEAPVGSPLRAYITCPENGRVQVPMMRLRCWEISPRLATAGSECPSDSRTVYLHHHAGQRLYVCIVNKQNAPFDFSVNRFRPVDQLTHHRDACLMAESRIDQRADFGCSYFVRIDLSWLVAELDKEPPSFEEQVFSVHWLVQKGEEPQLREDTVLRDSCRMRYVGGRITTVDTSSEEMFDEDLLFAKKQKLIDERQKSRHESIEQREELSSRLFHAVQNANVGEVLRVFSASVMQWARGLKRHLFDHFYLDVKDPLFCRMYQVPPSAGFQFHPYWITEPWIGMHEAYDLLEFYKSPEFAKTLAARVQTLLDARLEFSGRIVEETTRHEHDVDLEIFVGIDEERKGLRHIAFSLCEHLNLLASQFDAMRKRGPGDREVPVEIPVPDLTDGEDTAASSRNWPSPQDHTVAKIWTRKEGVLLFSAKTEGSHDGVVEFAPNVAGELTLQMRFMMCISFSFPGSASLAEIIEQVYPDEYSRVRGDADALKSMLKRLRSLVSDIRKKLRRAGLNPEILPSLNVEASLKTGIGLRLANLNRLDDKELDQADAAFI